MKTYGNLPINDLGIWRPMLTCPLIIWHMETYGNLPINDLGIWRPMVTCSLMIWAYGDLC